MEIRLTINFKDNDLVCFFKDSLEFNLENVSDLDWFLRFLNMFGGYFKVYEKEPKPTTK